ncbi:MAG: hypothetical protein KKI08_00850, partial [Armatimonadetes bacterium]|nr:hypothetical protein [Armatimonadota bacterium]
GDVDGALAGYYAERVATVAAQTGVAEGAIRRWCGERLITPQLTRGQVLQGPDDSEGLPNNAVNGLVDAYLVRAERRRGSNWFELAHDRLIEPVRRDNSAWFEEHLSPLQRQAALWEQQSRASVLLLRDDALVLVERWAAEHSGEMTATEQEFLRACREAQAQLRRERRQARLIRWATYALAVLTIVAVGAAVWAMSAGRSARAQHLAAASSEAGLRDQQLSLLLAVEATRVANEPATEQALRQAVGNVPAYHLTGHRGRVCTTRFSPDSRWLVTGDMGGLVQVRDLGRPLEAGPAWGFQWHGPISAVAINAAGDCLLVGTEGGGVTSAILNRSTMAVSPVAPQGGPPSDASVLACSLDGKWLVTRGRDGTTAEVWNLRAEAATAPIVLRGHRRRVVAAAITPDGRWVATGSEDLTARCWDLRAADPSTTALVSDSHSTAVTSLAITPDGRRLVAGSGDVRTYRVPQRQAKRRELYQDAFLTAAGELGQTVAVSPDGNTVAAGNGDGTTRLWDVRDMGLDLRPVIQFGQCHPQVLSGRGTRSCASALSPNGEWLVRAGYDGTVRRWHLRATYVVPSVHFLLSASQVPIQALAITSDGRWLVVGDDGSTVRRWDLGKRGSQPNPLELKVSECGTQAVAISEDGGQILSGGDDGIVWWHRMGPGAAAPRRVKLEGHHGGIKAIAIAGDGRWAITGSNDNTARAWDLTETQPQSPLPLSEEQCGITAVAVRDDGRMVLTGDVIGRARALDNPGHVGKMPRRVTDHTGSVTAAAVAADGRLVATGGADGTVLLCRTDLGRRWLSEGAADPSQARVLLNTHTGSIVALAFGDNDRYLVSHATDGTTLLWPLQAESKPDAWREAATHQTELLGCEPPVCATAISPDGKWLVTGNEEGETQLWLLPFEALLDHAEQRAVRSLSPWECWQFLPNRVTEPTFPGKPVPCSNSPWLNAR